MSIGKKTTVPRPDLETVRKRILALIEEGPRTALEISSAVRIPERQVWDHLVHLEKSLRSKGRKLERLPAQCLSCGFVFRKRDKLAGPGRCPLCRKEFISAPFFRVDIQDTGV
ncbi:MAG: hypothetical protein FWH25_04230 [Syntrophorhabdaceae bacterium]|nr:hypothetical protein [Syntrophorhabdaceae bacterium]